MAEASKRLLQLIRRYEADGADAAALRAPADLFAEDDPIVRELVFSLLAWNSRRARAEQALAALAREFVDLNDLRVCLAAESARAIDQGLGGSDARTLERAERLRAALNDLYRREHRVSLEWLASAGKREARAYLESLEGVPRAAALRVFLLCCGGHAVPVDDRLCALLAKHKCLDKDTDADAASGSLERQAKAGEPLGWFAALTAWADAQPDDAGEPQQPDSARPAREPAPKDAPKARAPKARAKPAPPPEADQAPKPARKPRAGKPTRVAKDRT